MDQSGLPSSNTIRESIASALSEAKVTGSISALNQLWVDAFNKVVRNPDNPSSKVLIEGLDQCKDKEQVLKLLGATINSIDLGNDQDLRDLFLIDLTAHLMTIGVYIELLGQIGVFDQTRVDDLHKSLAQHDQTKVFEEDGTTVNSENMKGYMLLPLVFGVLLNNSSIKAHSIVIPLEVKAGNSLENTCIAGPILSHVKSESHHPEYHIERNQAMSDLDISEFMVDGLAAGSRPDRFKADAKFSETLPSSLSFWLQRLGKEDGRMPKLWSSLPNAGVVADTVKNGINILVEKSGDVKLEKYFGQPLK